ncbi:sodium- and chloride-dependent glycine transporter 1 [Dermatophagoides farinae]|nr:sodium- and chloride-dependent glycine transporter 1-like [Dermatophagoides farinae]
MTNFTPIASNENIEEQIINCDLMDPEMPNDNDDEPVTSQKPDLKKKEWGSYTEFLLASLSYAVGLGNIWRFPYLVYRNGGGAFFVPYFIMLFFVGIPLFVLEFSFGQFMQSSPVKVWIIAPLFTGIGYAMCVMSGLVSIYYNMVIAWAVRYLITALFYDIDWDSCGHSWNTNECLKFDPTNCTMKNGTMLHDGTCMQRQCFFITNNTNVINNGINPLHFIENTGLINCTIHDDVWYKYTLENSRMPSDEYFHNKILGMSSGIDDLIGIRWDLAACLFICWAIVFACLYNGLKSMGKSAYFTAIFPYIVLTILLLRCIFLDGASDGISFYMSPEWERLKHVHVWSDAAMQIFFSLSPCWGGIITLAKGNSLRHNFLKDAFYISIGNCLTSVYAGFVIFSIIGFMAHEIGREVKDVVTQGAGLAFIVYPEAVSRLPVARFWAIIFFVMLSTLGFGTQFTLIESVASTVSEMFFNRPNRQIKRRILMMTCFTFFIFGLILSTHAGIYILQLMDDHCASISAIMIGFVELNVIVWVYGIDKFLRNAQKMLGSFPMFPLVWKFIWIFITPIILGGLFISTVIEYEMSTYGSYVYPAWASVVGWSLAMLSMSAIPIYALFKLLTYPHGSLYERWLFLTRPSPKWSPPRFGDDDDDDDDDDDSSDNNKNDSRNQIQNSRKSHRRGSKKHTNPLHLHLHGHAPLHCESQIALRNDEDDDNSDDSNENEYENPAVNHFISNQLRHNMSQNSLESDTGINLKILNSRK